MTGPSDGSDSAAREEFVRTVSSLIDAEIASELFTVFSEIALLRYEEVANSGLLLLCRPNASRDSLALAFETPFSLRDVRGVRKMLQVSDQHLCLLCDGHEAYGFTTVDAAGPETLTVQFYPHGMWELRAGGEVVLQICPSGATVLAGIDEECFGAALRSVFSDLCERQRRTLWDLISAAARQLRGTNVLISSHAAAEAERLGNQCTRVKPALLTPMLMERVSSIDGTVIIDTGGVCHAIGAILDGPVAGRGDRARGGRYNSAVM